MEILFKIDLSGWSLSLLYTHSSTHTHYRTLIVIPKSERIDAYPTVRDGRKKDYSDVIFICLIVGDLLLHGNLKKLSSLANNQRQI